MSKEEEVKQSPEQLVKLKGWLPGGISPEFLMVIPCLVWITIFLLLPLSLMLGMSFLTRSGTHVEPIPTIANYVDLFSSSTYLGTLLFTLRMSLTVIIICFVLAYPTSYCLALKIRRPSTKTLLLILMLIPFFTDWTVRTMGWFPLLGRLGLVNIVLVGSHLLTTPSDILMFSEFSATLVMVQSYVLFMIVPIFLSMLKIDPTLLRAAEILGATRAKAFYHVTLRLSLPGIAIGCIFVFTMTVADFATPRLIGGTIQTVGLSIASQMGILNWPFAAALSTVLVILTVSVIYVVLRIVDVKSMIF